MVTGQRSGEMGFKKNLPPATSAWRNPVWSMLDLHKAHSSPGPERERMLLARRIEATDRQIDRLVYEWYGFTGEEIGVVEGERRQKPGVNPLKEVCCKRNYPA